MTLKKRESELLGMGRVFLGSGEEILGIRIIYGLPKRAGALYWDRFLVFSERLGLFDV